MDSAKETQEQIFQNTYILKSPGESKKNGVERISVWVKGGNYWCFNFNFGDY